MGWLKEENQARCRQVYDKATKRQKDVLRAYARGLNTQQVATEMGVNISTVNSYSTILLAECGNAWELSENERLDFNFLSQRFMLFVQQLD